jgi:hypothetical protein
LVKRGTTRLLKIYSLIQISFRADGMSGDKDIKNLRREEEPCGAAEQADRCRRLARATYDRSTSAMLERMAAEYQKRAEQNDR